MRLTILLFLFLGSIIKAQSLSGLSGLFSVPTAETSKDGELTIGLNYYDNIEYGYAKYVKAVAPFITIGFLPYLELGVKFTNKINYADALGDRMLSVRCKIINEGDYLPAMLLGIHDFLRSSVDKSNYQHSSYFSLTKKIKFDFIINYISVNIGYGTKLLTASDYQYLGFFGGVNVNFLDVIELLPEYDSRKFNFGMRITLFNHIKLLGGFMDLNHFSGGLSFSLQL